MGKPKVFISHSAKDDEPVRGLLEELRTTLQPKFDVLIDMFDIPAASDWRRVLTTWIGDCHAAVLLLSKKALKSQYVAYETSILRYREDYGNNCKVIPVFVPPVDYKAIQRSALRTAAIDARQAVTAASNPEIIAQVHKALESVRIYNTPVGIHAAYIRKILTDKNITQDVASEIVKRLHVDCWADDDPYRTLSFALMGANLQSAVQEIHLLSEYLEEQTLNLFRIVAESWVDARSTGTIRSKARGERGTRALGSNATLTRTAECYIHRASEYPPGVDKKKQWLVASVGGGAGFGEDTLEEGVKSTLTRIMGSNLTQALEEYDLLGIPVFVVLPGAGLDRTTLANVRNAFKTVTFFVLAGDDPLTHSVMSDSMIETLLPPLEAAFERNFNLVYGAAQNMLARGN